MAKHIINISLQQLGIKGTEDWFFGAMTRDRANDVLLKEALGVFLIRASLSQPGSFALSVRDEEKTNHYKILATKRVAHDGYKFKIGQIDFPSMQSLIDFYKSNKLGDSTLTVPASKPMFRAKFDFKVDPIAPDAAENLALKRGDLVVFLETMRDPDGVEIPDWWRVIRRRSGESGLVPAIYLAPVTITDSEEKFQFLRQLSFPFDVEVARERNPNIFDSNQLRLEPDDIVEVLWVNEQQPEFWFGTNRRTQRQGFFPFNYVRPLATDPQRLTSQIQMFSSAPLLVKRGGSGRGTSSLDGALERL